MTWTRTRTVRIPLSADEVKGRNTWIVWSAGNDVMWDTLGDNSVGALDFLKVLSSHPSQKYTRQCDPARLASGACQNRWSSAWSTNRASRAPAPPTRTAWGCGSTSAGLTATRTRSRTRRNTPASRSARAARP